MKRVPILVERKMESDIPEPYGYIYITTNIANHKKYVGKHAKSYFDPNYVGSGRELKLAIKKYGKHNFICEPIQWASDCDELNQFEYWWTTFLRAVQNKQYYNEVEGGKGFGSGKDHPMYGKHYSEEYCKNLSKIRMGKSSGMKGKKASEETRRKQSEVRKGMLSGSKNGMYGRKGKLNPNYNGKYTNTAEVRNKISQSLRGKIKHSEEFKSYRKEHYKGNGNPNSKSIVQLDLQGNIVKIWSYLSQAHLELNISEECIRDCCKGRREQFMGYKWMYQEDYEKRN